jgi:hypothetical protein
MAKPKPRNPSAQQGVVLLYSLVVLTIMLIGAAAMLRSMNTSLITAGNIGFKRDLTNQASSSTASNYSATILATNAQGLPNALLDDAAFGTVGVSTNDIAVADQGVTIRWVVDRLCTATGNADASRCTMANDPLPAGGSGSDLINAVDSTSGGAGALQRRVVYRLSVRVTGPRATQAFFQSTLTI